MQVALLVLLLTGCAGEEGIIDRDGYQLDTRHPAQAIYLRIRVLVIHYMASDFDASLTTLTDEKTSSRYLIPEQPSRYQHKSQIWQLMPEEDLAWHTGASYRRGSACISDASTGIELENRGWQKAADAKSFTPFYPGQAAALILPARDIITRYHIAPQNVMAHADIASQRKGDLRPLFSQQQLAQQGTDAWPDEQRVAFYLNGQSASGPADPEAVLDLPMRYGYQMTPGMTLTQKRRVVITLQVHSRPQR